MALLPSSLEAFHRLDADTRLHGLGSLLSLSFSLLKYPILPLARRDFERVLVFASVFLCVCVSVFL